MVIDLYLFRCQNCDKNCNWRLLKPIQIGVLGIGLPDFFLVTRLDKKLGIVWIVFGPGLKKDLQVFGFYIKYQNWLLEDINLLNILQIYGIYFMLKCKGKTMYSTKNRVQIYECIGLRLTKHQIFTKSRLN